MSQPPGHRPIWSVTDWPLYFAAFVIQVSVGVVWVAWQEWPNGPSEVAKGIWWESSSLIITAAGLSLVVAEVARSALAVSRWSRRTVVSPLCRALTRLRRRLVRFFGRDVISDERAAVIRDVIPVLEEAVRAVSRTERQNPGSE